MAGANDLQTVGQAAQRWGVPSEILWGVYGMETDFGRNVSTSSAGAQGPFQFIPGTARQYRVNVNSLPSSAEGAAHYLHDLYAQTHSWDAALRSYSGGGYGLSQVQSKAKGQLTGGGASALQDAASGAVQSVIDQATSVARIADVLSGFFSVLTSVDFWVRAAEALAAGVLIYEALRGLTGQGPGLTELAGKAKRGAEVAGAAAVVK